MTTTLSILAQQGGNPLAGGLPMIIIMIVMFYFLLIRPQKKQRKEQEARVAALRKGDKVVTIGGMHGIVNAVSKRNHFHQNLRRCFCPRLIRWLLPVLKNPAKAKEILGVKVLEEVSKS